MFEPTSIRESSSSSSSSSSSGSGSKILLLRPFSANNGYLNDIVIS